MPSFQHNGASIYYEEHGQGFPLLTFAPGGLRSTIEAWRGPMAYINPMTEFADKFRVIVMDQRNAGGQSRAPITAKDNWSTYTSDHIALLDHLKIDKCHLYGQCIGGPFIMSFLKAQPQRVICAVPAQPSGRVGPPKPGGWSVSFENWTKGLEGHPEATKEVLDAVYLNFYGQDFCYSVTREEIRSIQTPCLLLAGNDANHPYPVSEEMSKLLPNVEFIPEWKSGEPLAAAKARIKAFLAKHALA